MSWAMELIGGTALATLVFLPFWVAWQRPTRFDAVFDLYQRAGVVLLFAVSAFLFGHLLGEHGAAAALDAQGAHDAALIVRDAPGPAWLAWVVLSPALLVAHFFAMVVARALFVTPSLREQADGKPDR